MTAPFDPPKPFKAYPKSTQTACPVRVELGSVPASSPVAGAGRGTGGGKPLVSLFPTAIFSVPPIFPHSRLAVALLDQAAFLTRPGSQVDLCDLERRDRCLALALRLLDRMGSEPISGAATVENGSHHGGGFRGDGLVTRHLLDMGVRAVLSGGVSAP